LERGVVSRSHALNPRRFALAVRVAFFLCLVVLPALPSAAFAGEPARGDSAYQSALQKGLRAEASGNDSAADRWFRQALAEPGAVDKSDAAMELVFLALRQFLVSGETAKVRPALGLALRHVTAPDKRKFLVDLVDGVLDGRVVDNPLAKGLYGAPMLERAFRKLLEKHEYSRALQMLAPPNDSSDYDAMVRYDTLALLVHGRQAVESLKCAPALRKYPNAYAYTMMVCAILVEFDANGSVAPAKVERLEAFFRQESSSSGRYLLPLVQELVKPG